MRDPSGQVCGSTACGAQFIGARSCLRRMSPLKQAAAGARASSPISPVRPGQRIALNNDHSAHHSAASGSILTRHSLHMSSARLGAPPAPRPPITLITLDDRRAPAARFAPHPAEPARATSRQTVRGSTTGDRVTHCPLLGALAPISLLQKWSEVCQRTCADIGNAGQVGTVSGCRAPEPVCPPPPRAQRRDITGGWAGAHSSSQK